MHSHLHVCQLLGERRLLLTQGQITVLLVLQPILKILGHGFSLGLLSLKLLDLDSLLLIQAVKALDLLCKVTF